MVCCLTTRTHPNSFIIIYNCKNYFILRTKYLLSFYNFLNRVSTCLLLLEALNVFLHSSQEHKVPWYKFHRGFLFKHQIKQNCFSRAIFILQWQVYHFRNNDCTRTPHTHTHIYIRYQTVVGVKFLSDTKTKEFKAKLLFLKELKQKQNFLV